MQVDRCFGFDASSVFSAVSSLTRRCGSGVGGWWATLPIALSAGALNPAIAQVIPDASLPNPSQVLIEGNLQRIEGGTIAGSNLFHSFSQFDLTVDRPTEFSHSDAIQTIITRVTNPQGATIDGLLRTQGNANFFFLSPGGVNFGANAQLDIGGAFAVSTAPNLVFANGDIFQGDGGASVLSVSVPLGLQWGLGVQSGDVRSGDLQLDNLQPSTATTSTDTTSTNITSAATTSATGLTLAPIAVQGSQLTLSAPLSFTGGEMMLSDGAIVTAPGITVNGASLTLEGGSRLRSIVGDLDGDLNGNLGNPELNSGNSVNSANFLPETVNSANFQTIQLNLTDHLTVQGFSETGDRLGQFSGIVSQTTGAAAGAAIAIQAPTINLSDRGFIASLSQGTGDGGAITLTTDRLSLNNGAQILSQTAGVGLAGPIAIQARAAVTIDGRSDRFTDSPFNGLTSLYTINASDFTTQTNPDIEAAETVPHVSLERTASEIRRDGQTIAPAQDAAFDYYVFAIDQPNSRAIFDIDYGGNGLFNDGSPGSIGSEIFLFDYATGNLIASQSGAFNPKLGAGGSTSNFDAYLDTTIATPGTYVIAATQFDSAAASASTFEPLIGETLRLGNTYILQTSIAHPGTPNLTSGEAIAAGVFNPNFEHASAIISRTQGAGRGGDITIEAPQIQLLNGGEISALSFGAGNGGHVRLDAENLLRLDGGNVLLATQGRGAGQVGNIDLSAATIEVLRSARIDSSTFGTGDSGAITLNASAQILFDSLGEDRTSNGIFSEVKELAIANSQDVTLTAPVIVIRAAKLSGTVRGIGDSGDLRITASESVLVDQSSDVDFEINTDARGVGGDLIITAPTITILDGTSLETEVDGHGSVGSIILTASDRVLIDDSELQGEIDERGRGISGQVAITAPIVTLQNGTVLEAKVDDNAVGDGGTVMIAADQVTIRDSTLSLDTDSGAVGNGGVLQVQARTIEITDGARISTSTAARGNAGSMVLNASDAIAVRDSEITGSVERRAVGEGGTTTITTPQLSLSNGATIRTQTEGAGNGGTITLNLTDLSLRDGSQISASTLGSRDGGNLQIQASGTIVLEGVAIVPNSDNPTNPNAPATVTPSAIRSDSTSTGSAGTVVINAEQLIIGEGAEVGAASRTGAGGDLAIRAPVLVISGGELTAETNAGDRANITIASETLQLRRGGRITTNATGAATGGNLQIEAETLVALENSDITANAENNFGGRIAIASSGIFGTAFRNQLTPASDITASSALGATFSGTVSIVTPEINTSAGLVNLPSNVVDPNTQIVTSCAGGANSLTATGRGGFASHPDELSGTMLPIYRVQAIRPLPSEAIAQPPAPHSDPNSAPLAEVEPMQEAGSWVRSPTGVVSLTTPQAPTVDQSPFCTS